MNKFLDSLFEYFFYIILLIFYAIFVGSYSIGINKLNAELIDKENAGWGAPKLLAYKDYLPIYYFFFSIILALIGALLISVILRKIKGDYTNLYNVIVGVVITLILLLLLICVIKLIMIPILRLIFSVVVIGIVLVNTK